MLVILSTWTAIALLNRSRRTADRFLYCSGHEAGLATGDDVAVLVVAIAWTAVRRKELTTGIRFLQSCHRTRFGAPVFRNLKKSWNVLL